MEEEGEVGLPVSSPGEDEVGERAAMRLEPDRKMAVPAAAVAEERMGSSVAL